MDFTCSANYQEPLLSSRGWWVGRRMTDNDGSWDVSNFVSTIDGDGVEEGERRGEEKEGRQKERGKEKEKEREGIWRKAAAFRGLSLNVGLQGKNGYIKILITIILCDTMLIILLLHPKKPRLNICIVCKYFIEVEHLFVLEVISF